MKYYKVKFGITKKGEIEYPEVVQSVNWERIVYKETDSEFIGLTKTRIESTEKHVVELDEKEALELMEKFMSNYPKVKADDILIPQLEDELQDEEEEKEKKGKG